MQQRLTAVGLFYDYLVEDGLRDANPVGRGRYAPAACVGGDNRRGVVPRQVRLPWIPDEADWQAILEAARGEPIRNRAMLALGYDAGLRREELSSLRADDHPLRPPEVAADLVAELKQVWNGAERGWLDREPTRLGTRTG